MQKQPNTWAGTARRAATVSVTAVASVSMLLSGSPFALAASLATGESTPVSTAAAAEKSSKSSANTSGSESSTSEQTNWTSEISSMLNQGSYEDGEVVAIVAPAAQGGAVATVAAVGDDDANEAEPLTETLLDTADTEELAQTTGDTYEDAFDAALPTEALEGAQLLAAAESDDGETEAVQASDVDVYTLLVKQNGMSTEQILNELADDSRVLWAEPNYTWTVDDGDMTSVNANSSAATKALAALDKISTSSTTTTGDETGEGEGNTETGSNDGADDTKATDTVEGVTVDGTTTVASTVKDATSFQWAFNGQAFGTVHPSDFTVALENWNNSQMPNSAGIVAVMDSGIDHTNPDLADIMVNMTPFNSKIGLDKTDRWGYNASTDDGDSSDVNGHGTHCGGIVAADWNGFGTSGAAYGAKLLSIRAANSAGNFTTASAIRGFNYLSRAIDAGADIRVASNSWGAEGATRSVCLAADELGSKGCAVIFAAGNSSWDLDVNTYTGKAHGATDFTTVVNSSMMTGTGSEFSCYGKTTTDVYAPGSTILSTAVTSGKYCNSAFLPELLNSDDTLFYEGFSKAKASNEQTSSNGVEAWLGIIQMDGESIERKQIGTVDTSAAGYDTDKGALRIDMKELKKATDAAGESGSCLVSLKVPVNGIDTTKIAKASIAMAIASNDATEAPGFTSLMVETLDENGQAIRTGKRAGLVSSEAGWNPVCTTLAEAVTEDGKQLAVHTDASGNKFIWLHLFLTPSTLSDDATALLIDSVGLGNKLAPYTYMSGTSMATPAVAGLAAVASQQMGSAYGKPGDATRAVKLTNLIKSSVNTFSGQFEGKCTSNGMIDASKFSKGVDRSPQITSAKLADNEETVTIEGSDLGNDAGSVTFGGKDAKVKSWSDTKVVIECPSGLASGYLELVLTRADKKSCNHAETFVFTKNVADDEVPVFEESIEMPSFFDSCSLYNVPAALDGSLYVFAGQDLDFVDTSVYAKAASLVYQHVWRYDIESKTWSQIESMPCNLAYVSTTLWKGKLLVMGATASKDYGGLATKKLFEYDPQTGKWTDLSDKVADDSIPYQAAIVNAGGRLLVVGGATVTKLPKSWDEAQEWGVDVGSKEVYDISIATGSGTKGKTMLTLCKNNVRELDLSVGKATAIGSVTSRASFDPDSVKSDIQLAYTNGKLYVSGGAVHDPIITSTIQDQGTMDCVEFAADGTTKTTTVGAYDTPQSTETLGALPVALDNYKLRGAITGAKNGLVLTGLISVTGFDETGFSPTTEIIADDTYLLKNGGSKFESIGKRVNYTPTVYCRAIAYRGKLYVIGHNFNGEFENIMRVTSIETDELPGDVTRSKGDEKKDESITPESGSETDGKSESKSESKVSTAVKSVLPKTGDIAGPAALGCLLAGGAALALARARKMRG